MDSATTFIRSIAPTSPNPMKLSVDSAMGIYIYDTDGKQYIDGISGIGVSSAGHSNSSIISAVQAQAARYMHTMVYGEHIQTPQLDYAEALLGALGKPFEMVYFVNSGAEAIEGVMKLAKRTTGRSEIIACKNAYHGSTQGAASLMSHPTYKDAFRPLLPGIRHIEFNSHDELKYITTQTACVITEVVQAEAGVLLPQDNYLQKLRNRCDETGTLLIFDEIQTGMGRTGAMFAFKHFGVIADVIALGKALGGGLPLGAFSASAKIMKSLSFNPILGHITTFGGNPVCCAAGHAAFRYIQETCIPTLVQENSLLLSKLLKHPAILEVRNAGLLAAVQLRDSETVLAVADEARTNGLLVDWFLFNPSAIRIAPPLVIQPHEMEQLCIILLQAIQKVCGNAS